jgi:hypothetical protein
MHVPSIGLVVAGDTAHNGVHLYLAESNPQTRREWIAALDTIEALRPRAVIAGHKRPGNDDSPKIIEETRQYIRDFDWVDGTTTTARELYDKMLELYPDHGNPGAGRTLKFGARSNRKTGANERSFLMRQLQLIAHGEPSDVIELNTVSEPALGEEDVLISMEAAPLNPSDFLFVRGIYGVRPAFPSPVGAEGVGRVAKIGSKVDVGLRGKRVLILPTYEQGTWADQVVVPVRPRAGGRRSRSPAALDDRD